MASRAERQQRRRRDKEGGGRRYDYENEGLEPDETQGRRHRDHEPPSRSQDDPGHTRAQVHRPRHTEDYREDDRNARPYDRSAHPRRYDDAYDDDRHRRRHHDSDERRLRDERRPRGDEAHSRPDDRREYDDDPRRHRHREDRPARPRDHFDDDRHRHRPRHHDPDDQTPKEAEAYRRPDDYSAQPGRYGDGTRRQQHGSQDRPEHSRRYEDDTSRRPRHPEETPADADAYDNAEQPRRDRRRRSRRRQPDSDARRYKEDDNQISSDDPSAPSTRDPYRIQPGQPYSDRDDLRAGETTFGPDEPPMDTRARVHTSGRRKPESRARRDEEEVVRPVEEEPVPPYSPPAGEGQQQHPTPPNKQEGQGEVDDEASSSTVTIDLEMVEMRHPRRLYRPQEQAATSPQQNGRRKYQKYQKSPSSDSAVRVAPVQRAVRASAYSTLSVKSWSELDTEISEIKRDLNKHFKPIFDKHGKEGVRVKKLTEELNSRSSRHLLSRESIAQRLRDADRDGDEYLSYADFVSMITKDLQQEKKMAFRGMLLSAIGSIGVLPKEKRDNFLASHKLCPPPLFIPIITLIQVIIFAVYVADMEERGLEVTASSGYPFYSPLPYMPKRRWQAWRFLTYMFIHDGYLHILYNVISQLLFGFPLEMVHGWWRTAIIYLTGVAAGSLAHSVVDPAVGLVGASGGVYAILGAHLAAVVTNWKEMNYKLCDQEEFDSRPCCALSRLFVSAPFRLALVVLIVLPDTALAIFRRVALDEDLRVGISAHVGGFLTGLFLGIPVLKNVNKHAWETNLGWVTLVVFLLVCAFAVFFNSFFDERYPTTDWST